MRAFIYGVALALQMAVRTSEIPCWVGWHKFEKLPRMQHQGTRRHCPWCGRVEVSIAVVGRKGWLKPMWVKTKELP